MLGRYKRAPGYVGWYECKVVEEVDGGRWVVVEWEDGDEQDNLKGKSGGRARRDTRLGR
jgi:hypothetical protein